MTLDSSDSDNVLYEVCQQAGKLVGSHVSFRVPIADGLAGRHVPVVYRGLVWFITRCGSCAVSGVIGGGGMRHLFYVIVVCSGSQMAQCFTMAPVCCDDGFCDDGFCDDGTSRGAYDWMTEIILSTTGFIHASCYWF